MALERGVVLKASHGDREQHLSCLCQIFHGHCKQRLEESC